METNYMIKTASGSSLKVTEEIFKNYMDMLEYSYPEYEVEVFNWDFTKFKETCKSYFIRNENKPELVAYISERRYKNED